MRWVSPAFWLVSVAPLPDRVLAMKSTLPFLAALLLAAPAAQATDATLPSEPLERGRYLVENIGLCADCHSPRNERGEFVMEAWLRGAALPFQPTVEMPWAPVAPPIAGLPSMNDAEALEFLVNGTRPDGSRPRPPMPSYRFNETDARAVIAYLRSLAN